MGICKWESDFSRDMGDNSSVGRAGSVSDRSKLEQHQRATTAALPVFAGAVVSRDAFSKCTMLCVTFAVGALITAGMPVLLATLKVLGSSGTNRVSLSPSASS